MFFFELLELGGSQRHLIHLGPHEQELCHPRARNGTEGLVLSGPLEGLVPRVRDTGIRVIAQHQGMQVHGVPGVLGAAVNDAHQGISLDVGLRVM